MPREMIVVPDDDNWSKIYEREKNTLLDILGFNNWYYDCVIKMMEKAKLYYENLM